jgi:hypothetical protein
MSGVRTINRPTETVPRRVRPTSIRRLEEGDWRDAFEQAVLAVQGGTYALPRDQMRDLDDAIDAHAPGGSWEAKRAWLAEVVPDWLAWRQETPRFRPLKAAGFLAFLNDRQNNQVEEPALDYELHEPEEAKPFETMSEATSQSFLAALASLGSR